MNIVKHTLWPVSYVDDQGKQIDQLYSFDPSNVAGMSYWVGDPIELQVIHPGDLVETHRTAKILEMREKLAKLEAGNEA